MTILIPSYEPDERLLELISKIKTQCSFNIVVIDDGSGYKYEGFFKTAKDNGCIVLSHKTNRGKGCALKTGFSYLKESNECEGVVCADSDGQHQVEDILRIAKAVTEFRRQIILGCRRFAGKVPFRSRFGNALTRIIYSFSTGTQLYDTQTGLRGYSSEMLDWLCRIPGERFEYEMNMLLEAVQVGYAFHEVDIETVYLDNNKSSHFRAIVDSYKVYLPFLRFGASSILSAVMDISLLLLLQYTTSSLLVAAVGARVCSSIFNYTMNKTFVFHKCRDSSAERSLPKYFLLVAVVLALNYLLLSMLSIGLGIPLLIAKLLTEAVIFLFSYWSQRKYVFSH